jgi:uncharacterized protein (DUF1501 family)
MLAGTARAEALAAAFRGRQEARSPRTLVLIQLSGGNDGLSTVVPFADDGYGRARDKTRLETRELLRLKEAFISRLQI